MKLDLILENVKNKYTMGLLEESELPEVELLAGKILINESIMNIRNMLVEEGTMSAVQSLLQENWEMTLFEEGVNGPWDKARTADATMYANQNEALKETFKQNPSQYMLNPMVGGPVTHGINRLANGVNNGAYAVFKNGRSDAISNDPTVKIDPQTGQPWNTQMDSAIHSNEEYLANIEKIKQKNPVQFYLNPMTPGITNNTVANSQNAQLHNLRSTYSPTTQVGSTLR